MRVIYLINPQIYIYIHIFIYKFKDNSQLTVRSSHKIVSGTFSEYFN